MIYIMQNLETGKRIIAHAKNEIGAFELVVCKNPVEACTWIVADEYQTSYYLSHEKEIQNVLFEEKI